VRLPSARDDLDWRVEAWFAGDFMAGRDRDAICSFCRKSYTEVGPLVEGPGDVYICGECIELCQHIVEQEKRRRSVSQSGDPSVPALTDVEQQLGEWFGGQPETVRDLGTLLRGHYQRQTAEPQSSDHHGANNVALVLGPRRSSKMLLARVLALILNHVPIAEVEASALRERPIPEETLLRIVPCVQLKGTMQEIS
jgi:ATP-dependent Clp protease ATP-binding subunit ClpX